VHECRTNLRPVHGILFSESDGSISFTVSHLRTLHSFCCLARTLRAAKVVLREKVSKLGCSLLSCNVHRFWYFLSICGLVPRMLPMCNIRRGWMRSDHWLPRRAVTDIEGCSLQTSSIFLAVAQRLRNAWFTESAVRAAYADWYEGRRGR
jgi:hypothetical protein